MEITVDRIKELRELTSCGVIECKKALEEVNGDIEKAKDVLKRRGLEIAAKKGHRATAEGRVEAYIHPGAKIGVLLEANCETDFVAKMDEFCRFTKDVAMHIAAMNPEYLKEEDIPEDILKDIEDKDAFIKEKCLLRQAFVRDPKITIQEYINSLISSIGENISIKRFIRYRVNES